MKTKMTATSTEEVLLKIGVDVVSTGREISCRCPFHADRHPSFSINAHSGLWICYQCGESGTLDRLLLLVSGEENPQRALREVRRKRIKRPVVVEEKVVEAEQNPFYLYARYTSFTDPPAWALEERMITPEQSSRYGLHWSKGWILPIWAPRVKDVSQDFWGWQFKRLDVVNNYPAKIKKSETLFGFNLVKERTVILVESPLDVVRLASVGLSAVASFGAFVSKYQLGLLEARFDRIVLALDNDKEGQAQTAKIYPWLAKRLPTRRVDWGETGAKDPGDLDDCQVKEVFE